MRPSAGTLSATGRPPAVAKPFVVRRLRDDHPDGTYAASDVAPLHHPGALMRRMLCALALSALPAVLSAQRDTLVLARGRQDLPRDVRREIVDRWNQASAFRTTGRGEIAEGKEVRGDAA